MIRGKRSFRGPVLALSIGTCAWPSIAGAQTAASIRCESEDQLELARRIASELSADGFTVDIVQTNAPSPCDAGGSKPANVPRDTRAWIRLTADPANPENVVASICYLGAQPLILQAAPSAPRNDANQLALATAEALNGLRSKLPPLDGPPAPVAPAKPAARTDFETLPPPSPHEDAPKPANGVVLGASLVSNLPDLPPALGATAKATLGIAPNVGLVFEALAPAAARELETKTTSVELRTCWFRLGPRLVVGFADFAFSASALAGPALTWATAVAAPPEVGTTDVSPGAVLTLGVAVEYPERSPVFASFSAAASALVPGVRVELEGAETPRGSWPVEASLGLGARWGSEP